MIYKWMKEHVGFHITRDLIFAINDPIHNFTGSVAEKKQQAFKEIIEKGYKKIQFFDDDNQNLFLVKDLQPEYPDVEITVYKADKKIFKKIENK
jgi:hypothetical protein